MDKVWIWSILVAGVVKIVAVGILILRARAYARRLDAARPELAARADAARQRHENALARLHAAERKFQQLKQRAE